MLGGGRGAAPMRGWLKTATVLATPRSFTNKYHSKGHSRAMTYRFFGKFRLSDFNTDRLSIIFCEPVHLIYYVLPLYRF